MRRLPVHFTAAFAAFSAFVCFACGARSELLSELGGSLGISQDDRDGAAFDDGSTAANKLDDAEAQDEASKSDASVNPCGGYQAYAPWPAFQRCSGHVGRSEAIGPASPVIEWTKLVGRPLGEQDGVLGPPTIAADGTIYVADGYSEVVAFAPNGDTKWLAQPTFVQTGPSAVAVGADGSLYVELDQLYAISPGAGSPIWNSVAVKPGQAGSGLLGPTTSSVTLSEEGQLYLGTEKGLYSVSPGGAVAWIEGSLEQGWTPAISLAGIIYNGTDTGELIASGGDGTTLWTFNVPGSDAGGTGEWIQAAPVIADDGSVYFGAASGYYAFSPGGSLLWHIPWTIVPPPGAGASVAIGSDGTAYIASPDSFLRSVSLSGTLNWALQLGEPGSPPVIDGNDVVYLLADNEDSGPYQTLYAVTKQGEIAWTLPLEGILSGSLAVGSDGTIYIAASPVDLLYAIGDGN